VWLTCPSCHAKLVGDALVVTQGVLVCVVAVIVTVAFVSRARHETVITQALLAILVQLPWVALNVWVTKKWARYRER
jgi:hypothetical protein